MNLQQLIKKEKLDLPEAEQKLSALEGQIEKLEKELAKLRGKRNKVKEFVDGKL